MKSITFLAFIALFSVPFITQAQVATTTATSTIEMSSPAPYAVVGGGYSSICSYVLAYAPTCNSNDYSAFRFAFDDVYRESILLNWRLKIFGPNYNHQI